MTSAANEAASEVGVDFSGGVDRRAAAFEVPAADFGFTGGQEGDDADRVVGALNDPVATEFRQSHIGHEGVAVGGFELGQLQFELGVERQEVGNEGFERLGRFAALDGVEQDDLGFVGEESEGAERFLVFGGKVQFGDGPAGFEGGLDAFDDFEFFGDDIAVGAGFFDVGFETIGAVGDDTEVGEEDFLPKRGEFGDRVAAGEVGEDDQEGVGLANEGEALGVVAVSAGKKTGRVEQFEFGA